MKKKFKPIEMRKKVVTEIFRGGYWDHQLIKKVVTEQNSEKSGY